MYPRIVITISLKASKPLFTSSLSGLHKESRMQTNIKKRHHPNIEEPRANFLESAQSFAGVSFIRLPISLFIDFSSVLFGDLS